VKFGFRKLKKNENLFFTLASIGMNAIEKNIVQLIQAGDNKFVELLYDHYSASLYGMVLRIVKDDMVAEDVMQDSFIKIWKKSADFKPEKSRLFTWLLTICRNTAIDRLRSSKKKKENEIQSDDSLVYNIGEEKINPEVLDIHKHLSKIDKKYIDVINALFFQGMTQQEISEKLNVPLGTVKTRLKIGLRELRKFYIEAIVLILIYMTIFS